MNATHYFPSYHNRPGYQKINHHAENWKQRRYRVLQSSLATLLELQEKTEVQSAWVAYARSIEQIRNELSALTVRS